MKNNPDNQGQALSKLLKEWRYEAPLPPQFQENVWRRIEQSQARNPSSIWAAVAHWISTILPRPALAASYLSVLLAAGATVGWTKAHDETVRVKGELRERYVQSINPYQTPREAVR